MSSSAPIIDAPDFTLYEGDALSVLRELPDESVDCVITSPPYWGLRDYGADEQLGLEASPDEYVDRLVEIFREVRRVLSRHGSCWLNLGDSYAGSWGNQGRRDERGGQRPVNGEMLTTVLDGRYPDRGSRTGRPPNGLKPKDLVGIPWRVAFALQADGWYLRAEVIWHKPNAMPSSVSDRPTVAHEQVFQLTRSARYYFDQEAVREEYVSESHVETMRLGNGTGLGSGTGDHRMHHAIGATNPNGRNIRSVWTIVTGAYPDAHFATFPPELVRRCLTAGCPELVCTVCGKPRERIVERDDFERGPERTHGGTAWITNPSGRVPGSNTRGMPSRAIVGERWTDCGHASYRPGIVLDPFIGSGTTALVAREHARRCVGIDLSAEYCQLAMRRNQQLTIYVAGA